MIFARIADFVVKHHKAIVIFWVIIFAAAIVANQFWKLDDITSYSVGGFLPKDTESAEADRIVADQFPAGTAKSTLAVVIVAPDATSDDVRIFAVDLDDTIAASQYISPNQGLNYNLTGGQHVSLDEPVKYMLDPSQSTIYSIYRSMAFSLSQNLTWPLHENVTYMQGLLGLYYGIPLYYVSTWTALGGTMANNSMAYSFTTAYIQASVPPSEQSLASGYFQVFAGYWNASFFQPIYTGATPEQRGGGVIHDALPVFLDQAPFPPEAKAMQTGFVGVFSLGNFAQMPLIENYTFAAFASYIPTASAAFFQDVYTSLPANATFEETLGFARTFIRAHDLTQLQSLLHLPYDPSPFFFSPDRTIMLMSYSFSQPDDHEEADGSRPVERDVAVVRNLVREIEEKTSVTFKVYVTGSAASSVDQGLVFSGGAEFIVTLVLVILLIGLYFRSIVSWTVPVATIGIAIFISNLFIYFIGTHFFTIDFTTPAVLQTILLAAGTDYSIFLISRYRDERLDGKSREEAVRQSVTWAGESIATSGGAVLLSFAALGLASFPIVKTMGISMGFAITVAIILSITLIPSLVLLIGNKVFWPYNRRMKQLRKENKKVKSLSRKYFAASARFSMRNAEVIVLFAILISIPATFLVLTQPPSYDFMAGVPPTESSEGLDAMSNAFGASYFYKSYIVIRFPDDIITPSGDLSIPKMYALENLTLGIQNDNFGVKSTQGPVNPEGAILPYRNWALLTPAQKQQLIASVRPYVGLDNRTARIFIMLSATVFSENAVSAIDQVARDTARIKGSDPVLASSQIYIGGATAIIRDVAVSTNHDLQVMAIVVAIGLFIILMIVLGSLLIPLRAILTILLSITWTLATTIIVFKFWKGLDMIFVLPLIVFVLAMGLGMDYDIFIITRVREEVSKGKTDKQAILTSISRTGGIVSACGIIMAGAFFSLMLSHLPLLQEMGFALAFVVLIDSMVVRIYLVPAIMVLAGKYNWWAPRFLQRVRRSDDAGRLGRKPRKE
jgi:RND superfamily putative drug exporter